MNATELTIRQRLALRTKACLISRFLGLSILSFLCLAYAVGATVAWHKERTSRQRIECTYKSTLEINSEKDKAQHRHELHRLGIENFLAKHP